MVMDTSVIFGLIVSVLALVWVFLCYKKIIPDPWAKWTLLAAGFLFTAGLYPLLKSLWSKEKDSGEIDPVVVVDPGPSEEEIEYLDNKKKNLDEEVIELDKELEEIEDEIDKAENPSSNDVDSKSNVELNPEFSRRIRELRERRGDG